MFVNKALPFVAYSLIWFDCDVDLYCIAFYCISFFCFVCLLFFIFVFISYFILLILVSALQFTLDLSFIYYQSGLHCSKTTVPIILWHDNNSVLLEFLCSKCVKIVPPGCPACHTTYFFLRDKMLFQPHHSTYVHLIIIMVSVIPSFTIAPIFFLLS